MTTIEQFTQLILDLPVNAINFTWSIINPIIIDNWLMILVIIIVFINIAMLKFFFTGRWATLGSLLYNIFYFGIMYLIIRICGPEIILDDNFNKISFLVYVAGFFLTRCILKALNIRHLQPFHH